jgi:hypothetical protein
MASKRRLRQPAEKGLSIKNPSSRAFPDGEIVADTLEYAVEMGNGSKTRIVSCLTDTYVGIEQESLGSFSTRVRATQSVKVKPVVFLNILQK